MPKVSVLMPVYNAERFLREAIDSILSQTFTDFELIIVNDGSTDKSEKIMREYSDPRIKYFKNEVNRGLIETRNTLINKAAGEYISFLDSDDVSVPDRLAIQTHFLDTNPDYAMCGSLGIMIDGDGNRIKNMNLSCNWEEIKSTLLFTSTFIQSSITIRRNVLLENPYDGHFPVAEDYELWSRLSTKHKLKNIPLYLTKYRWHDTNISQTKETLMRKCVQKIHIRELSKLGINATTEELELHASISNSNIVKNREGNYFKQLKTWLKKLKKHNREHDIYPQKSFEVTLCFRWIFMCMKNKRYLKSILLPITPTPASFCTLLRMLYVRIK